MNFTKEQLTKAKAAKSAEELIALAKENGITLTEEKAKTYFAKWSSQLEFADEELNNVSGGCGTPDPKLPIGLHAAIGGKIYEILEVVGYDENRGSYLYKCQSLDRFDEGTIWYLYEDMFI